ncbi:ribonuclease M5 [Anaeroselena agilis]|uniref:Ribonuclease M5 n=1 Tax=Anaeroselena agilis TaxID=3063788 RepID=A0ABU3P3R7_9FIRM|nr:ribonuclease M5 [Selenomonadales bacterium 4137-cl]
MIREVVVVEGKKDVAAVKRAVEAECLVTGGFSLSRHLLAQIEAAYGRNGIIILTDPDSAGERIRKVLSARFPGAKHAFVPREAATANDDVGIEQAPAEAIRAALAKARCQEWRPEAVFTMEDLLGAGLAGSPTAAARRAALGEALGIGYANAKTLLRRLNNYGVTRAEFTAAVAAMENNDA